METHNRPEQVVLVMENQTKTNSMETELTNKDHISTTTTTSPQQQLRHRPPKPPSKTLTRLAFSKPRARFADPPPHPLKPNAIPEPDITDDHSSSSSSGWSSDEENWSKDHEGDEEEEEEEEAGTHQKHHRKKKKKKKKKKINWRVAVEWVLFITITTCLVCSLTIKPLKKEHKWGSLEIWKWCLIVLVMFCGRLVSGWVIATAVFFIERNFMLREKVLYFVYGLRKSIQNCVWLGLVLLAWTFMFSQEVDRNNRVLRKFFKALVAVQIGATIWLVKIILVKMLASSFHVTTYFDRMKESVFHHYILETLSGPPVAEEELHHRGHLTESKSMPSSDSGRRWIKKKKKKEAREEEEDWSKYKLRRTGTKRIDMDRLRKLSMKRSTSAWNVKRLVTYVMSTGLSTISRTVDDFGKAESEITSEWEARSCAQRIFKNVAKPGAKYIEEEDLSRFLKRIEIHTIFPLFEGALETGKISKSSFRNWMVRAYLERKSLAHSLNDTKTAVQQLHKLASAIVIVIIIVVTLLVMELATSKVILFVTTQLILGGVIFQGIFKTLIESIILVFVMHPFDIGDRCVIDGVQMIVEEMNILTTVFLRYDNEKIYYPNSVLLTKPISNFYRSPEMSDVVNFTIDASTSVETIVAVKKAIQEYIESKPKYWNPKHTVTAKEIENMDKLNMVLSVQHTINHQNYGERNVRISELIIELKKIFEALGVKYNLLPQEVHLTEINNTNWRMPLRS